MDYEILVTPEAENQIEQALSYYKEQVSDKVANSFLNEYKQTSDAILKAKYFQVFFMNFRAVPMKKFPFLIFYTIDDVQKLIIIKAVFHTSQDPEKYPKP